jgi:hypothetical protein
VKILLPFLIALIIASCSSTSSQKELTTNYDAPQFVNMGYIEFQDTFSGCTNGMRVYVRNRAKDFFTCKENIPALNTNSIILLQKELKGTTEEINYLRAFKEVSKMQAESNFSGLMTQLRSFVLTNWTPPFKFLDCTLPFYKRHKIAESSQLKSYAIAFEKDLELLCQFEDSNGVNFYGIDISRLYLGV